MVKTTPPPQYQTDFTPCVGALDSIVEGVARVVAPNASPYTFTGTNSYIVGDGPIAVIDPGPNNPAHREALLAAIDGRAVTAIVLTHTHKDHSALARELSDATNAPIWFAGRHRLSRPRRLLEINVLSGACDWSLIPDRILLDGDILEFGTISLRVIATPGHCANHIALGLEGTNILFSGDHVMGWSSTLIAVPDGSLSAYFTSIQRLLDEPFDHYLPAHGGVIEDGRKHTERLGAHRQLRNTQILDLLAVQPHSLGQLRAAIYTNLPRANQAAAAMTLQAHLEYLMGLGKISRHISISGWRYSGVGNT